MSKIRVALLATVLVVASCVVLASRGAVAAPPSKVVVGVTYTKADGNTTTNAVYTHIVELNLPAGKYLIGGRGTVNNQQALTDTVSCNVYTGAFTPVDANSTTVGSGEYGALAFSGIATLSTAGVVWVECIAIAQAPGPFTSARLTATTAADVITVP
jgi:hypothetical protein